MDDIHEKKPVRMAINSSLEKDKRYTLNIPLAHSNGSLKYYAFAIYP